MKLPLARLQALALLAASTIALASLTTAVASASLLRGSGGLPASSSDDLNRNYYFDASVCPPLPPIPAKKITALYVFGDSFSDVGNVYVASNFTAPSTALGYYRGRLPKI